MVDRMTSPLVLSQAADPGLPTPGGCARRAASAGTGFPAAGCLGGAAGQHAAGRAAVDPCARRGSGAIKLGGQLARPAVGAAVPGLRDRRARPGGVLTRQVPGRPEGSPQGRAPGGPPARPARRRKDAVRRSRRCARAARRELAQVRGDDGHGSDPVGGGAAADRLDGAAGGRRSVQGPARAGTPAPARLRSHDPRGVRPLGGDLARGRPWRHSPRSAGR